jgi:predicted permease
LLPDVLVKAGPKARLIGHPHVNLEPGSRGLSELRRRFSQPLRVVMGIVMLVLLIACANVASLLLARATSRQRELAVRVSLGAGRGRVIRQLLTESVLLAALGGGLGLLVVMWSGRSLSVLLAGGQAHALDVQPDLIVLGFTLAISLVTGLAFGIVPALGASRVEALAALKGQTHRPRSVGRRFGLRSGLVSVQVAMSVVLLVGAALFMRTLTKLRYLDVGFDEDHVLALRLEPRGSNQKNLNGLRLMRLYGELLEGVQRVPGVRAASLAGSTPLIDENPLVSSLTVAGYAPRADESMHVRLVQIYPGYFSAMGIPLLAGRDIRTADNDPGMLRLASMSSSELQARCHPAAAIINETMARRFFGTPEAAVGRQFDQPQCTFQIVGVARDVRDRAMREEVAPLAYAPYAQMPTGRGQMTFLVRASGNPRAFVAMIERLAHELDPAMPLPGVETLGDRVLSATQQEQLVAVLASLFGGLALALAMIGLYGVLAYAVAQRTREIGIRMALGAARSDVVGIVVVQSAGVTAVGMFLGLAGAAAVTRYLEKMLFGLSPLDPTTFIAVSMVFGLVAMLASYIPARRATRVDPLVALRCE